MLGVVDALAGSKAGVDASRDLLALVIVDAVAVVVLARLDSRRPAIRGVAIQDEHRGSESPVFARLWKLLAHHLLLSSRVNRPRLARDGSSVGGAHSVCVGRQQLHVARAELHVAREILAR